MNAIARVCLRKLASRHICGCVRRTGIFRCLRSPFLCQSVVGMATEVRKEEKRLLVAFDFDHTISHENTDIAARGLCKDPIPTEVKKLYRHSNGWTQYMAAIFEILHKQGTTPAELLERIAAIKLVQGMKELLEALRKKLPAVECIIVSDSNCVFIDAILERNSLQDLFAGRVYTNPANWTPDGLLKITEFHLQDWCQLSSVNLCKGSILEDHVIKRRREGVSFSGLAYVGDGGNDLCPGLRLKEGDLFFVRRGFDLHKKLSREDHKLDATMLLWESGVDILSELQKRVFGGQVVTTPTRGQHDIVKAAANKEPVIK